jgi:hypothetical protein
MSQADSVPMESRNIAVVVALIALFVGAICAVAAFATSRACDVTRVAPVLPKFQAQYQTGYCQLGHYPGFPDTLGSGLFVAATWGLPVVVAIAGGITAVATGRSRVLWVTILVAGALALSACVVSASLADVHYRFI